MKGGTLAQNYLIQVIGKVFSVIAGFVMIAIITRTLGDFAFGEFTTAIVYLQIATVVIDLGLSLAFIQLISKPGVNEKKVGSALFGLRLLSAGTLLVLAVGAAFLTSYSLTIKLTIAVGVISYLSLSSSGMLTGLFQKHLAVHRAVITEVVNRTLAIGLVVVAASMAWGPVGMMLAIGLGNALQVILMVILAQRYTPIWPTINLPIWKSALKHSWPIGVGIFFNLIYLKSDVLILGWFHPQSEVGIYGAAYRLIDVFTAFPTMFMGLMLPRLVKAWETKTKPAIKQNLQTSFDFFAMLSLPLLVGTLPLGEGIMTFIAGEEFIRSGQVLPILMLVMPAVFFGAMVGHAVVAFGKQRAVLWAYMFTAVIAIGGYLLLIPTFGMWGAAWMTVVSEYTINIIIAIYAFKTAKFFPSLRTFAKAVMSCAVMLAILLALPAMHVLMAITIGATAYLFVMILLKAIRLQDVTSLISRKV